MVAEKNQYYFQPNGFDTNPITMRSWVVANMMHIALCPPSYLAEIFTKNGKYHLLITGSCHELLISAGLILRPLGQRLAESQRIVRVQLMPRRKQWGTLLAKVNH